MQYSRRYKRATLKENAERIAAAAASIKEWIIEKGTTPTGNIETYRAALEKIPIGSKVASGTFTTDSTGVHIDLDFKPKQIWVSSAFSNNYSGSVQSTETEIWSETGFLEYYVLPTGTGAAISGKNETNRDTRFPSVDTTGFTHKARYPRKTAYYIAIG